MGPSSPAKRHFQGMMARHDLYRVEAYGEWIYGLDGDFINIVFATDDSTILVSEARYHNQRQKTKCHWYCATKRVYARDKKYSHASRWLTITKISDAKCSSGSFWSHTSSFHTLIYGTSTVTWCQEQSVSITNSWRRRGWTLRAQWAG